MVTKKKTPVKQESPVQVPEAPVVQTPETITIQSVVDGQIVYIEGYSTLEPINETSKLVRYGDTNIFFTKK